MTARRRLLGLGAAFALAGCGLSERPYQERREWPLVARRPRTNAARPGAPTILVRDMRAAAGLGERGLRSLRADGSLSIDFYEEWSAPPANAVEESLRQWLAASGVFAAVLAPGSRLSADFALEPSLDAFIADRPAGLARVSLGLLAIDLRRGRSKVAAQSSVLGTAPLPTDAGPPQIAAAMVAALSNALTQSERLLARLA